MSESQVSVPLPVRLRFGHAALQHVADDIAVDVLHIKGAAVDPTLRPPDLYGTDVDVIVRPAQFPRLDRERHVLVAAIAGDHDREPVGQVARRGLGDR